MAAIAVKADGPTEQIPHECEAAMPRSLVHGLSCLGNGRKFGVVALREHIQSRGSQGRIVEFHTQLEIGKGYEQAQRFVVACRISGARKPLGLRMRLLKLPKSEQVPRAYDVKPGIRVGVGKPSHEFVGSGQIIGADDRRRGRAHDPADLARVSGSSPVAGGESPGTRLHYGRQAPVHLSHAALAQLLVEVGAQELTY